MLRGERPASAAAAVPVVAAVAPVKHEAVVAPWRSTGKT
jgi:hypothetical protein